MEKALWYLLDGTRGGKNRARIIRVLVERPQNANQISEKIDLDYNTVRYHLDKLIEHDVVETGGDNYGELYFLTDRFERHEEEFRRIADRIED